MKKKNPYLPLTRGALIASMYVALTYLSFVLGLSGGVIQFRLSEALCVLPLFMPEAVLGLFVGCLISNLATGAVIWDIIFGSLATLLSAMLTRLFKYLPKKLRLLSPLPTVLINALVIPPVLIFAYGATEAYFLIFLSVLVGEAVCAQLGGAAVYSALKKTRLAIFK